MTRFQNHNALKKVKTIDYLSVIEKTLNTNHMRTDYKSNSEASKEEN